jgi:alpha-tubulin suppressor-like RCC1 family protein
MTGGISSMIFLVEVDKTSGVEDQLFTFGKNSLNGLGAQPRNAETIIPWNPIALRGKKISQIACGGYHTLFLCGTKVYCVGYNSNGELGQIDSSSVADVKEMTWLEEPIRHISCGHFSTVFVTTDNKVLVTGCNEDNSLGVGESYNGRNVRRILTLQHFDFLVDDVFVGAYHWLIKTKRHGLFYTGKPR